MAQTINDRMTMGVTHSIVSVATNDITSGAAARVFGIYLIGDATVDPTTTIYNNTTATGVGYRVQSAQHDTDSVDFGDTGILFDTGISIAMTGSPTMVMVTYILE
jgi:hypothetical protein